MTMKGQKGITGTSLIKMESLQKSKLHLHPWKKQQDHSTGKLKSLGKELKINKFVIKIQSDEKFIEELTQKVREIDRGIIKPVNYATVSFPSLAEMRSTFTPNRLKLLSVIRYLKPGSIYGLSKILNRDRRHIMNDIKMLRDLGILKVKNIKVNGTKTSVLNAPYGEIDIALKL